MFNIVYFKSTISDLSSPAYQFYEKLYLENLLEHPTIYTDRCNIAITYNIPIFSTFYIRNGFSNPYILVEFLDFQYIPEHLQHKCIVYYNELFQDIKNLNCYCGISMEQNGMEILKEVIK